MENVNEVEILSRRAINIKHGSAGLYWRDSAFRDRVSRVFQLVDEQITEEEIAWVLWADEQEEWA